MGIGAVLMGAKSAILVDSDEESCAVSTRNAESLGISNSVRIINSKIGEKNIEFNETDLVISNPPWGTQKKGSDRVFLQEIISIGAVAHLMHSSRATHIRNFFNEFDGLLKNTETSTSPQHSSTIRELGEQNLFVARSPR